MSDTTPDAVPVAPEDEPDQIFPSATGVVVPDEGDDVDRRSRADSERSDAMADADVANGEGSAEQ